jgi:hypothetical protein
VLARIRIAGLDAVGVGDAAGKGRLGVTSPPLTLASSVKDCGVQSGPYFTSARRVVTLVGTDIRPWLTIETPDASARTVTSSRPTGVPFRKTCIPGRGGRGVLRLGGRGQNSRNAQVQ